MDQMKYSKSVLSLFGFMVCLQQVTANIDPATVIGCLKREFTYPVTVTHMLEETGEELQCSNHVTVDVCWGRCDSSEIPDYKVPFKISSHPVCSYGNKRVRMVQLKGCDPRMPDPKVQVIDATHCSCKRCSALDTSCQNWNG